MGFVVVDCPAASAVLPVALDGLGELGVTEQRFQPTVAGHHTKRVNQHAWIAPNVWRWTAPHPEWPARVSPESPSYWPQTVGCRVVRVASRGRDGVLAARAEGSDTWRPHPRRRRRGVAPLPRVVAAPWDDAAKAQTSASPSPGADDRTRPGVARATGDWKRIARVRRGASKNRITVAGAGAVCEKRSIGEHDSATPSGRAPGDASFALEGARADGLRRGTP